MTDELSTQEAEGADGAEVDAAEIAADYIEGLLDLAGIPGDIVIDEAPGRTTISVDAEGDDSLSPLAKPEVVAALQDLTRLAVQAQTGEHARLVLDVAGSRDARAAELERLVDKAAAAIDAGEAKFAMPAMSSYERKLVHDLVAERGLTSESEGEGAARHAVILPR